ALVSGVTFTPANSVGLLGAAYHSEVRLLDAQGNPVPGVPVYFTVTGANPTTGVAISGADGRAVFTYSGQNAGTHTITATVGSHSGTTTVTWRESVPTATFGGPVDGATYKAGDVVVFSGQAVPGDPRAPITSVTINGTPVEVIDAGGNFYSHVT